MCTHYTILHASLNCCELRLSLRVEIKDVCMKVMVHGFFGKYACKDLREEDVIELTIEDKCFNRIFIRVKGGGQYKTYRNILMSEQVKNNCVIEKILLPSLRQNIIKLLNTEGGREVGDELKSILALICTAQRYQSDIFYI
jgi:hypothetical protein